MVQAILANSPYPTLGEGVRARRLQRCADGLDAYRGEDVVKGGYELRVAVPYKEPEAPAALFERGGEIASALGDPRAGRVSGGTEDMDGPPLHLDHEEHVVAAEKDAVEAEEVSCQDDLRLGAEELRPARP
jgi:hypothetical protein